MKKSDIKKLDTQWSQKVRKRGICEACFRANELVKLEAAHIVGRIHRTTRWGVWLKIDGVRYYDSGGMCLCHACHRQYDEHLATEKFIREVVIGIKRYNALLETKNIIAKHQDYETIKGWIKLIGEHNETDEQGKTRELLEK